MSTWERRAFPEIGQRVELVQIGEDKRDFDPPPGTKGTVRFIDDTGTVHVKWDNGSQLGLIFEAGDRFKVID
jgi:uncharacterized protein DUF4314